MDEGEESCPGYEGGDRGRWIGWRWRCIGGGGGVLVKVGGVGERW